ncbi:MAG: MFS transporter [Chloroflexota bacterium]
MIKKLKFPRIFFGWWTVLATGLLAFWGFGYAGSGFSALFKPIASELGFSRAVTSIPASISRLEGGFEAPLSGWLTDKFGPRWVVFSGVLLMSLGLILMNFVNSLWAFYIVWGVIVGTGNNVALSIPSDAAISNWFVKKRGLALSIKWTFSGLSGALVLPLIAWLITAVGWRMTIMFGGVVMGLVGLPLAWFCLREHRPEYYGLLPDGATEKEPATETAQMINKGTQYAAEVDEIEFTARQAMRTRAFWLLLGLLSAQSLLLPTMTLHLIPFLTDMGIDPLKAAGMMAIIYASGIPARLVGGFLADRIKTGHLPLLLGASYLLQAVGILIFLLNPTIAIIYVWFVVYGVGHGAGLILAPAMRARYFGRKAFGSIGGASSMIMTPVAVIAPVYAGWVYDTTGSYVSAFVLVSALVAIAALLLPLARPPRPPAQVTDIRRIV